MRTRSTNHRARSVLPEIITRSLLAIWRLTDEPKHPVICQKGTSALTMVKYTCQVPGCLSSTDRKKKCGKYPWLSQLDVTFHPFPTPNQSPTRRRQWLRQIKRQGHFNPTRHQRICSVHFADFIGPGKHDGSVPTLFSWNHFGQAKHPRKTNRSLAAVQPPQPQVTRALAPLHVTSTVTSRKTKPRYIDLTEVQGK